MHSTIVVLYTKLLYTTTYNEEGGVRSAVAAVLVGSDPEFRLWHTHTRDQSTKMAKSIRSKVKKRLRTVKRGVVKGQLDDPTSKIGVRTTKIQSMLAEAATGHLKPGASTLRRNARLPPTPHKFQPVR